MTVKKQSSRAVSSNQIRKNPKLSRTIARNLKNQYTYPVNQYTLCLCKRLKEIQKRTDIDFLLDSGCGTGDSTITIAENYPDSLILGIDKSWKKLKKALKKNRPKNILFIRDNLVDLWLGLKLENIKPIANFIFYPNPWPKQKHLRNRWHAHPVMTVLVELSEYLELRTNWQIYANEFSDSLELITNSPIGFKVLRPRRPISAFEEKYLNSDQTLFQIAYSKKNPHSTAFSFDS